MKTKNYGNKNDQRKDKGNKMNINSEYIQTKEVNKDNYRLVHIENEDYEYQIEYYNNRVGLWYVLDVIYYKKCGIIDLILQNYTTYEEQAKKEFINQMRVLNKKENKTLV